MTILWIFVSNRFRTEFSVCSLHTVQFVVAQSKNLDLSAAIFLKIENSNLGTQQEANGGNFVSQAITMRTIRTLHICTDFEQFPTVLGESSQFAVACSVNIVHNPSPADEPFSVSLYLKRWANAIQYWKPSNLLTASEHNSDFMADTMRRSSCDAEASS